MNRSRPRTFPRPLKAPHASSGPSLPPERQPLLYVLLLFMPILELQGNSCVQLFHWPREITHAVLTSPLLYPRTMGIPQFVNHSSADWHWMVPVVGCSAWGCCGHSWVCLLLTQAGSKIRDLMLHLQRNQSN